MEAGKALGFNQGEDMGNELVKHTSRMIVAALRGCGGEDKAAVREEIKAAVRGNPGAALVAIGSMHGDKGSRLPALTQAVEKVLSTIEDREAARRLLDANITPQTQAEMTACMGDLGSDLQMVVGREVILAALEADAGFGEAHVVDALFQLSAWARNIKSRPDWNEILEGQINGVSLRDLLISGVYGDANEDPDDISPDMWEQVGLDPDEGVERLNLLIEEDTLTTFGELEVAKAQKRLRDMRLAYEDATAGVVSHDASAKPEDEIET
jgi:hypothetical protein